MSSAPLIGALLGLLCGLPLLLDSTPSTALLLAGCSIALLAFATRALHLDGLADTADALGSAKPAQQALEIARRSDIGPFGVTVLVLNLLLQAFALSASIEFGRGLLAFILAVTTGRIALTWACTSLWSAARADGLGAAVAGSVPIAVPIIWVILLCAAIYPTLGLAGVVATGLGLLAGGTLLIIANARLAGVTGDVYGSVIESTTTVNLIALALLLPRLT